MENESALFLGDVVENFDIRLIAVTAGDIPAAVVAFELNSGQTRFIKMTSFFVNGLLKDIETGIREGKIADERDQVIGLLQDAAQVRRHPELMHHPLAIFNLREPPSFPADVHRVGAYVLVIHTTASQVVFHFDMTFADGETTRFSMPTSLVWIFKVHLANASTAISRAR